ncbi:MAG: pyridoxal 5'-phosphate synthase [Salinisphaera sp.]|nr:pyridoxal 5'-phosphate synthase [Salinisphaera sp.]
MSSETLINAITRLHELIESARASHEPEANAAALATTDGPSGRPTVRTIYVHVDDEDIVFFVNAASGKGRQLEWNAAAALCFFWRHLAQQVTLDGRVEILDDEKADALWQKRTRESALAARASRQDARQGDKVTLSTRYRTEKERYDFSPVERPEEWIAYRLLPERIEFWETGWHRMRMRTLYERQFDGQWEMRVQEP